MTLSTFSKSGFARVAVLMGGDSAEREISLAGGQKVVEALRGAGIDVEIFDPAEVLNDQDAGIAKLRQVDAAFLMLHGPGGEDGKIQGLLEYLRIPYTGSGVFASALGMDKLATKQIWRQCGFPTPEFWLVRNDEDVARCAQSVVLPAMIKPRSDGSSFGMSIVRELDQLGEAVKFAQQYGDDVLIERYIKGKEFTVGVVAGRVLPVIRVETANEFYDFEAKYKGGTQYHLPSGLSQKEELGLQALCMEAFECLGCEGWGRIDLMQDQQGEFWLLEVNTTPGMTEKSLVPKAAAYVGISFDAVVMEILKTASINKQ